MCWKIVGWSDVFTCCSNFHMLALQWHTLMCYKPWKVLWNNDFTDYVCCELDKLWKDTFMHKCYWQLEITFQQGL